MEAARTAAPLPPAETVVPSLPVLPYQGPRPSEPEPPPPKPNGARNLLPLIIVVILFVRGMMWVGSSGSRQSPPPNFSPMPQRDLLESLKAATRSEGSLEREFRELLSREQLYIDEQGRLMDRRTSRPVGEAVPERRDSATQPP